MVELVLPKYIYCTYKIQIACFFVSLLDREDTFATKQPYICSQQNAGTNSDQQMEGADDCVHDDDGCCWICAD
jgi:hypothetical protein